MIAVSTSLLVLGWHFPSDVLGGLLLASGFFCLAVAAIGEGVMDRTTVLARRSLRVERARLGDWSGVVGAAALAAAPP